MKNKLLKSLIILTLPLTLLGCAKKEKPITSKEESTIIKNATNVDEYLKKKDYKSVAYAYIYNIKEGLTSYESETNGSLKAKIMFFDYNIKYSSITYKSGSTFYSKDDSTSTLMNVQNEFYMTSREKILVSRDLKKYDVYTMEDYSKVSYSVNQYTIMGYVFNDESIISTELLSDKDDNVSIKYTLDNDKATNLVKVDLKATGGLSSYPSYEKIEITLSMKKDFTPISYSLDAVYEASKAVLGTSKITQNGECLFSKINENITIPNEDVLKAKLGEQPSEIIIDDEERKVKDDLNNSLKKLDFEHGVFFDGDIALNFLGSDLILDVDANLVFDVKRLTSENIYEVLSFYAKASGDENLNSLISIIQSFAGDKLGEYGQLLNNFKSIEIVYDGNGSLLLIPTNQDNVHLMIIKIRLTDVLDLLLQNINLYNLVSGANQDMASFKRIDGKDENNFQVEMTLNEETISSIKEKVNTFLDNPEYSMIKMLLSYKDFGGIKLTFDIVDSVFDSVNGSISYINNSDESVELIKIHAKAESKAFDFDSKINEAEALYSSFISVKDLRAKMEELTKNVYVSKGYIANVEKALDEYNALSDAQKAFLPANLVDSLNRAKTDVSNIIAFLDIYHKYDLDNVTNKEIYELLSAYHMTSLNTTLLKDEMGEEEYLKLTSLADKVDYLTFDNCITKFVGEDETLWGLTQQEIKDIKLILDIASIESGVSNQIMFKLMLMGYTMSVATLTEKINNLYNQL